MSKYYAVEPCDFGGIDSLRRILSSFGTFQGSYIVNAPSNWIDQLRSRCSHLSDIQRKRLISIIQRLERDAGVFRLYETSQMSPSDTPWITHLSKYNDLKRLSGIIYESHPDDKSIELLSNSGIEKCKLHTGDEFESPTNFNFLVAGKALDMASTCEVLLRTSREAYFVDPYLDLCKPSCSKVMKAMLDFSIGGRCEAFIIFTRNESDRSNSELLSAARHLLRSSPKCPIKSITIIVCKDQFAGDNKLHARYIFTAKGGLKFDKGFQLAEKSFIDISVVSKQVLDQLDNKFCKRDLPFEVEPELRVHK